MLTVNMVNDVMLRVNMLNVVAPSKIIDHKTKMFLTKENDSETDLTTKHDCRCLMIKEDWTFS